MGRLGLVLAGGAARGAYEAGVLRFVFGDLVPRLGTGWPDIVSGTSVGALNGTYVAARDVAGLAWLGQTWRDMRIEQIYGITYADLFRTLRSSMSNQTFALADPAPLRQLVARNFPRHAIRRAIDDEGVIWMVAATELATGTVVQFVDAREPVALRMPPSIRVVQGAVGPLHCLASAALPILFPPVRVRGDSYVDGGLRHNTPLRPVLRAGADRIFVVSMKRRAQDAVRLEQPATLSFIAGKTLHALLLDPVEQEIFDVEKMNGLVRWGESKWPGFRADLEDDLGVRDVQTLLVSPSEDLGAMAADIYRASPPPVRGALGLLLQQAAGRSDEADLLSYLYFDRAYTGALEALGHEDARRQEEPIARLLTADRPSR